MNKVYVVARGGLPSYAEWSEQLEGNVYVTVVNNKTLETLKEEPSIKIINVQQIYF